MLLARLACQAPGAWLLDEPTSHQDPAQALLVAERLRAAADAGRAVLVVWHDLELAARVADRVVLLACGQLANDGPPSDVLTPETLARVYGVRARIEPAEGDAGLGVRLLGRAEER